eukprot:scaffold3819_cov107-Isochrysis_galbana.AAC.12
MPVGEKLSPFIPPAPRHVSIVQAGRAVERTVAVAPPRRMVRWRFARGGPWTFLAVVENVGLGVHSLKVEEEISNGRSHVRVADFAERWAILFDGNEVVRIGDEVGVVPLFRRLLRDGRRARWGGWSLVFALLRRERMDWGQFVCPAQA